MSANYGVYREVVFIVLPGFLFLRQRRGESWLQEAEARHTRH